MIVRADITTTDGTTPEPGVFITVKKASDSSLATVFDANGALMTQPFTSGSDAKFTYGVDTEATYIEEYRLTATGDPKTILRVLLSTATPQLLPTGTITLPAAFNNQLNLAPYWDGNTVKWPLNPYDAIDFDNTTATNYYVAYATGSDTNAGTTSGAPFKTFKKAADAVAALAAGSSVIIHLLDNYVGYLSLASLALSSFSGRNVKVKGEGAAGFTRFVMMREDWTQSSFAWAAHGTAGAWKSNAATVAGNYSMQFYLNGDKIPMPLVSTGQSAASVQSTAGTSFWDGAYLYVHLPNGAQPNPFVNWEYSNNATFFALTGDSGALLFENCGWFTSAGGANFNGFNFRSVADTNFLSQTRLGLRNCFGYGSSGNIFGFYDAQIVVFDKCTTAYARNDLFNVHAHQTTGTKGAYITSYETDCVGHHAGFRGFNDGASGTTSDNVSTRHDSMHALRANGTYGECNGAVVADVNGVVSVNLNCSAAHPGATANPKACFWHSGTGAGSSYGMYLWGCTATNDGDSSTVLLTNSGTANGEADGQIYVAHQRGQTNGTVVGALKDWNGNALANLAAAV